MRLVTLCITYDMDDPDKPLDDELNDWLKGSIDVQDLIEASISLTDGTKTVENK